MKEQKPSDFVKKMSRKMGGPVLTKAQLALIDREGLPWMGHFERLVRAHLRKCRVCRRKLRLIKTHFGFDAMKELGL